MADIVEHQDPTGIVRRRRQHPDAEVSALDLAWTTYACRGTARSERRHHDQEHRQGSKAREPPPQDGSGTDENDADGGEDDPSVEMGREHEPGAEGADQRARGGARGEAPDD